MSVKTVRPVWSGKLIFSSSGEEMNVALVSSQKPEPFSFVKVHSVCSGRVKTIKKREEKKAFEESETKKIRQQTTLFCPVCREYVNPHDVKKALLFNGKVISLDNIQMFSEIAKREAQVQFTGNDDIWSMIQVLSSGRWYYISPLNPPDAQMYIRVILTLISKRWVGFLPAITIGEKTFRAVLKPMSLPQKLVKQAGFGKDMVLIIELLNPLETMRLPTDIPRLELLDNVPRRVNPEDNGFKKKKIPSKFFSGWLFLKIKEMIGKS